MTFPRKLIFAQIVSHSILGLNQLWRRGEASLTPSVWPAFLDETFGPLNSAKFFTTYQAKSRAINLEKFF